MSTFPSPDQFATESKPSSALAIASLVLGILGFFIPGLGLIAIILGVIALSNKRAGESNQGGRGLAIAGTITGGVSLFFGVALCAGILLPALGKARQSARELKSTTQVRAISQALAIYAQDNKNHFPETADGWETRLTPYGVGPEVFVSPRKRDGWTGPSYVYVPLMEPLEQVRNPSGTIVVYEDPALDRSKRIPVGYLDGSVRLVPENELAAQLARQQEAASASKPRDPSGSKPKKP